jgi:hypothetical protein
VQRRLEALDSYCDAIARPPASILRSHLVLPLVLANTAGGVQSKVAAISAWEMGYVRPSLLAGTPDDVVPYYQSLVKAGMQYFISTIRENDFETLRLLAQRVIPAVTAK